MKLKEIFNLNETNDSANMSVKTQYGKPAKMQVDRYRTGIFIDKKYISYDDLYDVWDSSYSSDSNKPTTKFKMNNGVVVTVYHSYDEKNKTNHRHNLGIVLNKELIPWNEVFKYSIERYDISENKIV